MPSSPSDQSSTPTPSSSSPSAPIISNLWSKFVNFADRQRLERLEQCRDLDLCVTKCLDAASSKDKQGTKLDMEDCVPGIRMVKFFGWRTSTPVRVDAETTTTDNENSTKLEIKRQQPPLPSEQQHQSKDTCAREIHSQWGCRAVALGCSKDLLNLKYCFQKYPKEYILASPVVGYGEEDGDQTRKNGSDPTVVDSKQQQQTPCLDLQRIVGDCVRREAAALEKRMNP